MALINKNQTSNTQSSGQWEKAIGFINFALPNAQGKLVKVGALPLKESVEVQLWINELLTATPEQLPKLLAKMVVTYNAATPVGSGVGFSLD